jgi:hypothetical protein
LAYVTGLRQVERNLAALYAGERKAIETAMREIASLLAAYAKNNHPWQAQTGNTDNSTRADIVKAGVDEIVVALTAGMSYDIYLELAHSGQWAWLWPAMTANRDKILEILAKHGAMGAISLTGSGGA